MGLDNKTMKIFSVLFFYIFIGLTQICQYFYSHCEPSPQILISTIQFIFGLCGEREESKEEN